MSLLALHELIASTADGLHPDILRLLDERARLAADPAIASLADHAPGRPMQAGPSPPGRTGLFVPGNVARLDSAETRQDAEESNSHQGIRGNR